MSIRNLWKSCFSAEHTTLCGIEVLVTIIVIVVVVAVVVVSRHTFYNFEAIMEIEAFAYNMASFRSELAHRMTAAANDASGMWHATNERWQCWMVVHR